MKEMTATAVPRKRILCLEDDADTREMMDALLSEFGYEPVIVASATDALERTRSGGLALCILDHWITDGSGVDLCREIRALDPQTPIMFYSGAGYPSDIQKGLDAGAQAYLVKPDFDQLKPTIDRLIDEAEADLPTRLRCEVHARSAEVTAPTLRADVSPHPSTNPGARVCS